MKIINIVSIIILNELIIIIANKQQHIIMSRQFSSFALFLPRVELQHVDMTSDEYLDYITQSFYNAGYGVVSKVHPMLKTDVKTGTNYYSAIVYFERWFCTDVVYNFLLDLERTKIGNKFVHCTETGKYWYVQKHIVDRDARAAAYKQRMAEQSEIERALQEEMRLQKEEKETARRLDWVKAMRLRDEMEMKCV